MERRAKLRVVFNDPREVLLDYRVQLMQEADFTGGPLRLESWRETIGLPSRV